MLRIYLDNNATIGVDPRVLEAMLQELSIAPANPSSRHFFGREARYRLLRAREQIDHFEPKIQVNKNLIYTSFTLAKKASLP
jgi:cysteine sulfinate desulfinase/cysteine desulfurase-like protein